MSNIPNCPECRSPMEEGYIPDNAHLRIMQMHWHRGKPKDKKFLGMKTGGIKFEPFGAIGVTTYRCSQCGLLRSYAHKEKA